MSQYDTLCDEGSEMDVSDGIWIEEMESAIGVIEVEEEKVLL